MNITPELLTAYALGECAVEDRAAVEAYLADHPEARAEVEAIREAAALVVDSLGAEASPGLGVERRTALDDLPTPVATSRKRIPFPHWVMWPGVIAAGLAYGMLRTGDEMVDRTPPVSEPQLAEGRQIAPAPVQSAPAATSAAETEEAEPVRIAMASDLAKSKDEDFRGRQEKSAIHVSGEITTQSRIDAKKEASASQAVVAAKSYERDQLRSYRLPEAVKNPTPASTAPVVVSQPVLRDLGLAHALPAAGSPLPPAAPAEAKTDAVAPGEGYPAFATAGWHPVSSAADDANRLSTFGADVDTASYANVRRFLRSGQLPPADAVRSEELINAFHYDYRPPASRSTPFAVHPQVAVCPWDAKHRLVRIGLKGYELDRAQRPPANLVFLVDVSGSMNEPTKLPLVQRALTLLTAQLRADDHVALVTYAGSAGLRLESTSGEDQARILAAIAGLDAGGSTNGAGGIALAYEVAARGMIRGGVNRVVLCTDGDFNVGVSSREELERLITEQARSGVFLTALGFGMGNYQDTTLQVLADKGNGAYAYIDSEAEARKHLVDGCTGTLVTIAKDVKIQVEFNPTRVAAWRLIGYEKRALAHRDFLDDRKDGGEIGAGHTVTALYEIEPLGERLADVPQLRYAEQQAEALATLAPVRKNANELLTVSLRWKLPDGATSNGMAVPIEDAAGEGDSDLRFAAAVAEFAEVLRRTPGPWDPQRVLRVAQATAGHDPQRLEFIDLVRSMQQLGR